MKCPVINSKEWKDLVNTLSEKDDKGNPINTEEAVNKAWTLFILNNETVPTKERLEELIQEFNDIPALNKVRMVYDPVTLHHLSDMILDMFYKSIEMEKNKAGIWDSKEYIMSLKNKNNNLDNIYKHIVTVFTNEKNKAEQAGNIEKASNFGMILDNFYGLMQNAMSTFKAIEGFEFDVYNGDILEVLNSMENDFGVSELEDMAEDYYTPEEKAKEGWQINYRQISALADLPSEIKRVLFGLKEKEVKVNKETGEQETANSTNFLGYHRKVDASDVKKTILRTLKSVEKQGDIIMLLKGLLKDNNNLWAEELIEKLEDNPHLKIQFFRHFNKAFTNFSVIKLDKKTKQYNKINVNVSDFQRGLVSEWGDNITGEEPIVLNEGTSIYNAEGLNTYNATEVIMFAENHITNISKIKNPSKIIEYAIENSENISTLLKSIGVSHTTKDLEEVLSSDEKNISIILTSIMGISSSIIPNKSDTQIKTPEKLVSDNSGAYSKIARLFDKVNYDVTDDFVHELGAGYSSYRYTSYLSDLFKRFNNKIGGRERFQEFIKEEFLKYGDAYYNEETDQFYNEYLNLLTGKSTEIREKFADKLSELEEAQLPDDSGFIDTYRVEELQKEYDDLLWKESKKYRDMLEFEELLHYDSIENDNQSNVNYVIPQLINFFSGDNVSTYTLPVMSNSMTFAGVKFVRYNNMNEKSVNYYKDIIVEKLKNAAIAEFKRIQLVEVRKPFIDNFDTRGDKFLHFPYLNGQYNTENNKGLFDRFVIGEFEGKEEMFNAELENIISENMDKLFQSELANYETLGLFDKSEYKKDKYKHLEKIPALSGLSREQVNNLLENYFWNNSLFIQNIVNITIGDLAFFKSTKDFNKRFKQIYSPGEHLDTEARFFYRGEEVGNIFPGGHSVSKKVQNTMIINDEKKVKSSSYNQIKNILKQNKNLVDKNGNFNEEGQRVLATYENINRTDGGAYRTLDSAVQIITMAGQMNDAIFTAYLNIKKGDWDFNDYNIVYQNFKPFSYGNVPVVSHKDNNGDTQYIRTSTQHKDSEMILLPNVNDKDSKLNGMYEFMTKNDIDLILFESAVKVGGHSKIDLNNTTTSEGAYNILSEALEQGKMQEFPYEYYKIQQPVPEHLIDTTSLVGTQLRKLLISNFSADDIFDFEINGKKTTKDELLQRYTELINENLLTSFENLLNDFKDVESVYNMLVREIRSNARYDNDWLKAIELEDYIAGYEYNENGEKGDAIIKKRFSIPSYEPLRSVKFQQLLTSVIKKTVTKQKITGGSAVNFTDWGMKSDLKDDLRIVFKEDGSLDYFEGRLPFHSMEFIRKYMEGQDLHPTERKMLDDYKKTGILDISILSDEARKIIGYRIPTENKYSMIPIKIVEFLPQNGGSNLQLPTEITNIAGLDFDIDKEYIILPTMQLNYDTGKYEVIPYSSHTPVKDLTLAQRDNQLKDIMWAVLTHPKAAVDMFTPGGFDTMKRVAKEMDELNGTPETDLDITLPSTQIFLHNQNAAATHLIGIWANHNTSHAILQQHNVTVKSNYVLNGKSLTNLSSENSFTARNVSEPLAASVDAVKEPVFLSLNVDLNTVNVAALLARTGYSWEEIGLFLNQPVIKEFTKIAGQELYPDKDTIIKQLISKTEKYIKDTLVKSGVEKSSKEGSLLTINELERSITQYKKGLKTLSTESLVDHLAFQIEVANNFAEMLKAGEAIRDLSALLKVDTIPSGPKIADTISNLNKIDKIKSDSTEEWYPLSGVRELFLDEDNLTKGITAENFNENKDILREKLNNAPLKFLQGFYTLGLESTKNVLNKVGEEVLFPQLSTSFQSVVNRLIKASRRNKLSPQTINKIYQNIFEYYMELQRDSAFDSLLELRDSNQRDMFIKEFPKLFKELRENDDYLANLKLFKSLKFDKKEGIVFNNAGKLSTEDVNVVMREWEQLLYDDDYKQLAIDLAVYTFYKSGFNFEAKSFAHLIPSLVKEAMPEYINYLRRIQQWADNHFESKEGDLTGGNNNEDWGFWKQFILRNLDNKDLVNSVFAPIEGDNTVYKGMVAGKDVINTRENPYGYFVSVPLAYPNPFGDSNAYYSFDGTGYKREYPIKFYSENPYLLERGEEKSSFDAYKEEYDPYHYEGGIEEKESDIDTLKKVGISILNETGLSNVKAEDIDNQTENKQLYSLGTDNNNQNTKEREALYKQIRSEIERLLEQAGIPIGALTELEERKGITGVFDPSVLSNVAKDIGNLIRVAKGIKGDFALPEEFGHFIEAALRNEKIMGRLSDYLAANKDVMEAVFNVEGEGKYEEYKKRYNDRQDLMLREAIGKMIGRSIVQQIQLRMDNVAKPKLSILQSFIERVKNIFKRKVEKVNVSEYDKKLLKADKMFSKLATSILDGKYFLKLNPDNIIDDDMLYKLNTEIDDAKTVLEEWKEATVKRLSIINKNWKERNVGLSKEENRRREAIRKRLDKGEILDGNLDVLKEAWRDLKILKEDWNNLEIENGVPGKEVNDVAKVLLDGKTYIEAYRPLVERLIDLYEGDTGVIEQRIYKGSTSILDAMNKLEREYIRNGLPLTEQLFKPFFGDRRIVDFKGKEVTLQELIKESFSDITFMDTWIYSMANSNNLMLRTVDQIVRTNKDNARLLTTEDSKIFTDAHIELEQSGIKNTDFMYENKEGEKTGNLLQDRDYETYWQNYYIERERLKNMYPNDPDKLPEIKKLWREWHLANSEKINGYSVPKRSVYSNPEYEALNTAQKRYYDTIINEKRRLDKKLPMDRLIDRTYTEGDYKGDLAIATSVFKAPQIRKSFIERLKGVTGAKGLLGELKSSLGDTFLMRETEDEMGNKSNISLGFDNKPLNILPVYYTNRIKDTSQLSTDLTSSMIVYANMANNFSEMTKVVSSLSVLRDVLVNKYKINATRGNKKLVEKIKYGKDTINKDGTVEVLASNLLTKFDEYIEAQVYGKYIKDAGVMKIGKKDVPINKALGALGTIVSLNGMAFNFPAGISNSLNNRFQMWIEGFSGQFFSKTNIKDAKVTYTKNLPYVLKELGNRVKKNKLSLFSEKFNIMQDQENRIRGFEMHRKTKLGRALDADTMYMFNNMGEHSAYNEIGLALAYNYKMIDPNGKETNLWDAMEVVETGNIARLVIKKGYTKTDGTAFNDADVGKFSRKSLAVYQRLNGIYNKDDMAMAQRNALAKLFFMFKKHIVPQMINRRWQQANYDYNLDAVTEGFYRTFLRQAAKAWKSKEFADLYSNLSDEEKANMIRTMVDIIGLISASILTMVLLNLKGGGDDDDDNWGLNMLTLGILRTKNELGSVIPNHQLLSYNWKTFKAPVAATTYLENVMTFGTRLVTPWNWADEVERGRHTGKNKLWRSASGVIPGVRMIDVIADPKERINVINKGVF